MRIRPRTDADLPGSLELLRAVHAEDGYPVHLPEDPATFLAPPDMLGAWVAEGEGGGPIVGHVALRARTSPAVMEAAATATGTDAGQLAAVARLLVAPRSRRRGLGRTLLEAAARRAVALGRRPVLDVVRTHAGAVALYDRSGWSRAAEVHVTFPNGLAFDELVFVGPQMPGEERQR